MMGWIPIPKIVEPITLLAVGDFLGVSFVSLW